jgi:hypothetical protein
MGRFKMHAYGRQQCNSRGRPVLRLRTWTLIVSMRNANAVLTSARVLSGSVRLMPGQGNKGLQGCMVPAMMSIPNGRPLTQQSAIACCKDLAL